MAINSNQFLEKIGKLNKKNKELQQQLQEATESIDAIKTGNIDAVIIANEKALKVYTENTANNPYRILIEKMNEGAVTLDKDGTILYCNSCFSKMAGRPLQKVIGTKFKHFTDNSSKDLVESLFQRANKKTIKEEIYLSISDGKSMPVLISVNTVTLNNNLVVSIILTDLTIYNKNQEELKRRTRQVEEKNIELESANKDLTAFTYVSSHDLQEPLRKIQTFVNLLFQEEHKNLSDSGKHYFLRMQETASRMQALIKDLLTYSRAKITERIFEKTDLTIIVNEAKKDFEEVIQEKKATIAVSHLCEIKVIPFQFRQLIHNLISNSIKFSDPKKRIRIIVKSKIVKGSKLNNEKLSPTTDYCHIVYIDNGIGFDLQYKERIFEVFQRLHSKETYPGTGMGLAICKRIVENHNGIITATGALNKGTRFDIYIPAN